MVEYWYGFTNVMLAEPDHNVREQMLRYMLAVAEDAHCRPWPTVRTFSETVFCKVADPMKPDITWGNRYELRDIQHATYTTPKYMESIGAHIPLDSGMRIDKWRLP